MNIIRYILLIIRLAKWLNFTANNTYFPDNKLNKKKNVSMGLSFRDEQKKKKLKFS